MVLAVPVVLASVVPATPVVLTAPAMLMVLAAPVVLMMLTHAGEVDEVDGVAEVGGVGVTEVVSQLG